MAGLWLFFYHPGLHCLPVGLLLEEQTKSQCSTQDVNTHKAQATEDVSANLFCFCCTQKYICAVNRGRENTAQPEVEVVLQPRSDPRRETPLRCCYMPRSDKTGKLKKKKIAFASPEFTVDRTVLIHQAYCVTVRPGHPHRMSLRSCLKAFERSYQMQRNLLTPREALWHCAACRVRKKKKKRKNTPLLLVDTNTRTQDKPKTNSSLDDVKIENVAGRETSCKRNQHSHSASQRRLLDSWITHTCTHTAIWSF